MKKLLGKKSLVLFMTAMLAITLAGCGESKVVHCDHCGAEIKLSGSSNVDEDWTVYCDDCEKELGLDKIGEE